jgi:hypothetical protein
MDLKGYSFIRTYKSFDEIFTICEEYTPDPLTLQQDRVKFCKENGWGNFVDKLGSLINHN